MDVNVCVVACDYPGIRNPKKGDLGLGLVDRRWKLALTTWQLDLWRCLYMVSLSMQRTHNPVGGWNEGQHCRTDACQHLAVSVGNNVNLECLRAVSTDGVEFFTGAHVLPFSHGSPGSAPTARTPRKTSRGRF